VKIIEGGSITDVPGFRAAGVHCGLKKRGALDLALVASGAPCRGAAVFTTNRVQAAPVVLDREILLSNGEALRAVAVNAGCANACTGAEGMEDARRMVAAVEESLGLEAGSALVMSTGVIGMRLPLEKIAKGLDLAASALTPEGGHDAARAIMTTDTVPKEVVLATEVGGETVVVGGMAKGSGMIHPNMATMLSLIATDAVISRKALQVALNRAADRSFNLVTVDGDTSTNDTVVVLANGQARNHEIDDAGTAEFEAFARGLDRVCETLAQAIVRDGEGASKVAEIRVKGAASREAAKRVAFAVAHSPLVKTALFGRDANWGRIMCAVGYSGVEVDPNAISIWFDDLHIVRGGVGFDVDEERALEILSRHEVPIIIDLKMGDHEVTVWTCDLSYDYVRINAAYRT